MRIWLDTEFQEYATDRYVLISLGAVREDGAEFYAEADWWDPSTASEWLTKNVVPSLSGKKISKAEMRQSFASFCRKSPEFWGYFSSHDWFLVCDMMGGFLQLPRHWPQWCNDIQTLRLLTGQLGIEKPKSEVLHNALSDAKMTKAAWELFSVNLLE